MSECCKCGTGILVSDNPLACGICSKVFHQRCTEIKKPAAKLMADYPNILFKCDECLSAPGNGSLGDDKRFSEVKREMEKLFSISRSFVGIRENIDAQINSALEKGTTRLIESFNEVLRDNLASFENSVARKLEDLKSLFTENLKREKLLAEMNRMQDLESNPGPSKKRKRKNGKPIIVDSDCDDEVFDSENVPTFADVLSGVGNKNINATGNVRKQSLKERKARPVIVIKPVEMSKTSEDTRKDIKNKLDPKRHKISNFRNGKDGSIIVECATGDNVELMKNDIASNLGAEYNAVIPTPAKPKIKIVGMSDQYSDEEFVDLLRSQNDDMEIKEVKVIAAFENPRFKYNKYNVIVEVDKNTFQCLMTARKVRIGWDKCAVYEAINVLRCFKCGEFGHKSTECANKETCSKCNGDHTTSDCSSTDFKCVNCMKINLEQHMSLDVGHPAYSAQCPVFQKLWERKKKQLWSRK